MSKNPFVYQAPTPEHIKAIAAVRAQLETTYECILTMVPPCAERTLAIRKLEEASMWANKAIVFDGERYLA